MSAKRGLLCRSTSVLNAAIVLLLICAGCGWKNLAAESWPDSKPTANATEAAPLPVLAEWAGTVTESRHHPLLARTKGRIKRLFFEPGQYVRPGDILVKGYDHNFVVAPTHALVAERLIEGSTYLAPSTVVASLLEVQPFQIQLMPPKPFEEPVVVGWEARLSRWDTKTFAASGVVVGSHLSTDGAMVVDLRLRRLAGGALPVGTKIRAVLTPPAM